MTDTTKIKTKAEVTVEEMGLFFDAAKEKIKSVDTGCLMEHENEVKLIVELTELYLKHKTMFC